MPDADVIHRLISAYFSAYEARDSAGCAAVYSDGALVLSPWGPPVRGPVAIAQAHENWFEEGETNKVMTIEDLVIDGAAAFCLLHYSADIPASDGAGRKVFGASLNTLQRQPSGGWKICHTSLTELENGETGFTT